jgi:cyclic pyranopterin phosphate synthase
MSTSESALTHLDEHGRARMVDVGPKPETARAATARGTLRMAPATRARLLAGDLPKGEALPVARIAAIQAVKRTAEVIPLCHPLRVTGVEVRFTPAEDEGALLIEARVTAFDRTGVEMEALHAVTVAALTLYDMAKAVDRGMVLTEVRLCEKSGGRSGAWTAP